MPNPSVGFVCSSRFFPLLPVCDTRQEPSVFRKCQHRRAVSELVLNYRDRRPRPSGPDRPMISSAMQREAGREVIIAEWEVRMRRAPHSRPVTDSQGRSIRQAIEACTNPKCGSGYIVTEDGAIENCSCVAEFRRPLPPLARMDDAPPVPESPT